MAVGRVAAQIDENPGRVRSAPVLSKGLRPSNFRSSEGTSKNVPRPTTMKRVDGVVMKAHFSNDMRRTADITKAMTMEAPAVGIDTELRVGAQDVAVVEGVTEWWCRSIGCDAFAA